MEISFLTGYGTIAPADPGIPDGTSVLSGMGRMRSAPGDQPIGYHLKA
jgi:hypothetical protein